MNRIVRNIPNSITCLNLLSGCIAIYFALHGSEQICGLKAYQWAYIFIGIAAVADFCDGFAARLLKAYSNLGKELDSLCDLVSFGVAPAMLVLSCYQQLGLGWGAWSALLIPIGGALRLARFNIDNRQTTSFIGLPIPANAIFWIGFTSILYTYPEWLGGNVWALWVGAAICILIAYVMISNIPFFSLKFQTWGWRGNARRWILIASAVVFIVCFGVGGLFWLMICYAALSIFVTSNKN